jgi:hypothetical protein
MESGGSDKAEAMDLASLMQVMIAKYFSIDMPTSSSAGTVLSTRRLIVTRNGPRRKHRQRLFARHPEVVCMLLQRRVPLPIRHF